MRDCSDLIQVEILIGGVLSCGSSITQYCCWTRIDEARNLAGQPALVDDLDGNLETERGSRKQVMALPALNIINHPSFTGRVTIGQCRL